MIQVPANDLSGLKYFIFPAKPPRKCEFLEEYNAVYRFWDSLWTRTFAETGNPDNGWRDHFLRQDVIVALMDGKDVVGAHLYSLYNVHAESTKHSDYFKYVEEATMRRFNEMDIEIVMTLEYLCVNSKWSKNKQSVSVGALFVALGARMGEYLGADCGLGMPIAGTSVDRAGENIGAYTIQSGIKKFGYDLKLMLVPTTPSHQSKNEEIRSLVNTLWNSRMDWSGLTLFDETKNVAA